MQRHLLAFYKVAKECDNAPLNLLNCTNLFVSFTPTHNDREFKKNTTATATATSLNKRFSEQNNRCARAL